MAAFERPFNRAVTTRPADGAIVCRGCPARAGYRLSDGTRTLYVCPRCASDYDNIRWQHEPLPHVAKQGEENLYGAYKELRQRLAQVTPAELGEMFILTFKPRIAELEARYQAELAGKVRAS